MDQARFQAFVHTPTVENPPPFRRSAYLVQTPNPRMVKGHHFSGRNWPKCRRGDFWNSSYPNRGPFDRRWDCALALSSECAKLASTV
jgi:hypothetical protein